MYAKVFDVILDSSIWEESHATVRVWLTMLCMSDENGVIQAIDSAIRKRAGGSKEEARITDEEWKQAITTLESPDLESKDQDYGGRRIERIEGGWLVLNKRKYRDIRTKKQLQDAERQRRKYWRDRGKEPPETATSRDTSRTSRSLTTNASVSVSVDGSKGEEVVKRQDGSSEEEKRYIGNEGEEQSTALVPKPTADIPIKGDALHKILGEVVFADLEQEAFENFECGTLFAYWRARAKKPNAVWTEDRFRRAARYWRIYGLETCLYAVDGAFGHPDHNHESGKTYHDFENIFLLGASGGPGRVEKLSEYARKRNRGTRHKVITRLMEKQYEGPATQERE